MSKDDHKQESGYLPNIGFLTADEIAIRLRLRQVDNLKSALDEKGLNHVTICGKRLYDCSQLERLFFED